MALDVFLCDAFA
ncbi:hypothetical protein NTH33_003980 [Vibrio mimicus]